MVTSRTKQFLYLIFGGGLYQVSNFIIAAILSRRFGRSDYGTYRQIILVCQMIVPIFSASLPNSFLFFLPRIQSDTDRSSFIKRTVLILLFLGGISSLFMNILGKFISVQFNNPELLKGFFLASAYPIFFLASSFLVPLMIAVGNAKKAAIYSSITSAIYICLTITVAYATPSLEAQIIALSIAHIIFFLIALYLSKDYLRYPTKIEKSSISLREQLSYSIPLALGAIISTWGLKIDKAVVATYFDPQKYAVYSNGAFEIPVVGLISTSIFSVLLPEASRLMREGKQNEVIFLWKRTIEKSMILILPLMGIGLILSHSIITALFSNKYLASIAIFQIYILIIPGRTVSWSLLLKSVGKTKYDLIGSIIFFSAEIVLSILMLKLFNIKGAAIATVASVYVLVIYYLIMTSHVLKIKKRDIISLSELIPIMLVCIVPILGLYIFKSFLSLNLLSNQIIYLSIYAIIILAFLVLTKKYRKILAGVIQLFQK